MLLRYGMSLRNLGKGFKKKQEQKKENHNDFASSLTSPSVFVQAISSSEAYCDFIKSLFVFSNSFWSLKATNCDYVGKSEI